jgi:hypothetical protein
VKRLHPPKRVPVETVVWLFSFNFSDTGDFALIVHYLQKVRLVMRSNIVMAIGGRKSKSEPLSRPPTKTASTLTNQRKY